MRARVVRISRLAAAAAVAGTALTGIAVGAAEAPSPARAADRAETGAAIPLKDARLKFEINATDGDGGIQVFVDAEPWREMSIFDPAGRRVFRAATAGSMGRQGGTELFLESAEPPFGELPVARLLARFPQGRYAIRGIGLSGERYAGAARISHRLPDGPRLVAPRAGGPPQDPDDTTVVWEPVAPPAGGRIIAYQVLVVQPETGLRALPKVSLDVTMPPTATRMRVPAGFLRPGSEYEWEVLAIEAGGNQTITEGTYVTD